MNYDRKAKKINNQNDHLIDDLGVEEEYPIEELVIKPASFEKEKGVGVFPTPTAPQPQSINNPNRTNTKKSDKKIFKDKKNQTIEKIENPLWLSVSEAAKLGGVQDKTVRRALKANLIKYKISNDRYLVELDSLLFFLKSSTKLKNKLVQFGLGQYVDKWKKGLGIDKNK